MRACWARFSEIAILNLGNKRLTYVEFFIHSYFDSSFNFLFFKLADQLKMYKLDVEKKDRLINELSNYREVERVQVCNHSHDSYIDKSMFEQNKRELASLSAKYESIQNEVSTCFLIIYI